ncbi:unnamed protein product [Symbiodinium natans]|uniref:Uncharacterized protein n=1 Tax=Symbiodinium natans TaxID=878477 RepID=A0A812V0I1_9DINO|nr:unnamed protein product [Symbiodinium natans]
MHKAGGTTFKTAFVETLCSSTSLCLYFEHNKSRALAGGKRSLKKLSIPPDILFEGTRAERMRIRVVVVADYWSGVCSLLPRRCLYLTTLREPTYLHISFWNFLCVRGSQDRLLWNKTERKIGECQRPPSSWPQASLSGRLLGYWENTSQYSQQEVVDLAVWNLWHPCFWFLHTQSMRSGALSLKEKWSPYFNTTLSVVATLHENAAPHASNVTEALSYELQTGKQGRRAHAWANQVVWASSIPALKKQWDKALEFC